MDRATYKILQGDCIESMRQLDAGSVHCCVTSPPYWGLRDYGNEGQIGLEETPEAYVARMVEVFREVRRVLRDDGTCWVNLGDSYAASSTSTGDTKSGFNNRYFGRDNGKGKQGDPGGLLHKRPLSPLPAKNLVGIPWRVAFALQADGWYLRQDIIWHKPNPMPESVRDRCTKAHEYVFLLSKSARYFYDADAVSVRMVSDGSGGVFNRASKHAALGNQAQGSSFRVSQSEQRNKRSVWTVTTKPYSGAHFAVFPPKLIEPCILAGCPVGGTVLDPFGGSGTTAVVALQHQRKAVLCELNGDYIDLAHKRIGDETAQSSIFDLLCVTGGLE